MTRRPAAGDLQLDATAQRAAQFSLRFDAYEYRPQSQAVVAIASVASHARVRLARDPISLPRSDAGGACSVHTVVDTWALLYDETKT